MTIDNLLKLYVDESKAVTENLPIGSIEKFIKITLEAYTKNQSFFACGNGGNAAFCANLITDLNLHPFVDDSKNNPVSGKLRFKGYNLCDSVSTITGILNDVGPEFIFSEQLKINAKPGDVLFCISGSGNSRNIKEAMMLGKILQMKTVLITRTPTGSCRSFADVVIEITGESQFPGQTGGNNNNFHFEDSISKISHMLTGVLKNHVK